MNALNPQQNADGTIDIELDHPVYGWIPFTASPNDPHGVDLYAQAVAGNFGPVTEYAPQPEPEILPEFQNTATPPSGTIPVEVL